MVNCFLGAKQLGIVVIDVSVEVVCKFRNRQPIKMEMNGELMTNNLFVAYELLCTSL